MKNAEFGSMDIRPVSIEVVQPTADKRKSWVGPLALASVLAPVAAVGFGLLSSGLQAWTMKIVFGSVAVVAILVGLLLAIIALVGSLRQERSGSTYLAGVALSVNGVLLLGFGALIFALGTVAYARNTGYTLEEMQAMPKVIPGSRAILDDAFGFRLEIPGDFFNNQQPQSPQVLYSFLHAGSNGVDLCVNIERLGGWIAREPVGLSSYLGRRSRVAPPAEVEQAVMSWKTHRLEAFHLPLSTESRLSCTWAVQVPLAREPIQIVVCGRPDASEKCREVLEQLLTGLVGISNWDPPSVRRVSTMSLWPGPRASQAAEPAPPTAGPVEPIVTPGHSEIRTFLGAVPKIPNQNSRLNCEFDLSNEPTLIHVPSNYDSSTPFGLIVFLPGDGPFEAPPRGWDMILEQRKLLFVSPQKALNSRDWDRRCALAVVCVLKMREMYNIDPARVYAAGYSGGARMASMLGYYHADLFSGTIQSCGSNFHRPVPAVKVPASERNPRAPYGLLEASPAEIKAARQKVRFVLITGPRDFRYGHLLDIYEGGFVKDGFQAKLIDDPWMDHVTCGPLALDDALDFIERGRSP